MSSCSSFTSLSYSDDHSLFSTSSHVLGSSESSAQAEAAVSDVLLLDLKICKPSSADHDEESDITIVETSNNVTIDDSSESVFTCYWLDCGCNFLSQKDLVEHVQECHISLSHDNLYRCEWKNCTRKGKGFTAKYKILVHLRTHTKERPHVCTLCGKQFTRVENLKIHYRSHTGEKPYKCREPGCNKAYTNTSDRFKHARTHYVQKPYCCKTPNCNKRYTDPGSLRKHARAHNHYSSQHEAENEKIHDVIADGTSLDLSMESTLNLSHDHVNMSCASIGCVVSVNSNSIITTNSLINPAHQTLESNPLLSSTMLSTSGLTNYDTSMPCGLNLSFSANSTGNIAEDSSLDTDDSSGKNDAIQETPLDLSTSPMAATHPDDHSHDPAKWEFIIVDNQS